MTTNDIIDGVSIKLNEIEKTYEIYTNSNKQGLKMPCFFIKQLPSNKKRLIGNRFENELNLVIHVLIEDEDIEELNNIGDKLYELEYITLLNGDIFRGIDMKTKISDGVLLFFITYKYFTYKNTQQDTGMENINIKGGLKYES